MEEKGKQISFTILVVVTFLFVLTSIASPSMFLDFITNPYVFWSLIAVPAIIGIYIVFQLRTQRIRDALLGEENLHDRDKLDVKLKEYTNNDVIKECSNCTMCRDECPTYYSRKAESYYAGGRLRVLRAYVEKGYPVDDDFIEAMYYCTTCKQCEDRCPVPVKYVDILEGLRKNLVDHKVGPYGKQLMLSKNVNMHKNPYGETKDTRANWAAEEAKKGNLNIVERGPYAYFVGCTASFRTKSAALNTATIINKITGGFVLLGSGEYCCGSPLIRTGQVDFDLKLQDGTTTRFRVKDLITNNVESMILKDVKEVIYSCSGCYKTSMDDWPKFYGKEIPFKRTHITQFLQQKLEEGTITFKPLHKKITYHDPCHLGRHSGEYDAPRAVLKAIPGVELIEMGFNRNRSRCCGAGGGVKTAYPKDALEMSKIRVKEAIETGADILATSCVFCKFNFLDAKKELGANIEIMNIEDIVVDLLEVHPDASKSASQKPAEH